MSSTEMYAVKQGYEYIEIGECRNAHRGAMYVWDQIARKYFNLKGFPLFDEKEQSKVWNADSTKDLLDSEKAALISTMDRATLSIENAKKIIGLFIKYGEDNPNSSFSEQAKHIESNIDKLDDGYSIAWNQTSVNGDLWFVEYPEYDEESDSDEDEPLLCDLSQAWGISI